MLCDDGKRLRSLGVEGETSVSNGRGCRGGVDRGAQPEGDLQGPKMSPVELSTTRGLAFRVPKKEKQEA